MTRKPVTSKCEEVSCTRLGASCSADAACLLGGDASADLDDCCESLSLLLLLLEEEELEEEEEEEPSLEELAGSLGPLF